MTYVAGTLTVTKAPLTISAGNYTKKQGDAMPQFAASYSGFKNDETEDVLTKKPTITTEATVASAPGEYAVTVSGAEADNYEMFYENGIVVVEPDPLGIDEVDISAEDSKDWWTISGLKLPTKPQQKGIYIHGGKKVIVR